MTCLGILGIFFALNLKVSFSGLYLRQLPLRGTVLYLSVVHSRSYFFIYIPIVTAICVYET